jgi:hypothetical protein
MAKQNDLSRSLIAFEQNDTLIAVIEMSLNSWLVAGIVPAVERQPLKKMSVDEEAGWPGGCGAAVSKPTSYTRRALRSRVSIAGPRPTGSTPNC